MKKIIFIFVFVVPLFADTWIGAGGGISYPLKSGKYAFEPGIGWNLLVQHNLHESNEGYWGFTIGINSYSNHIVDFFYSGSSINLNQNDIQLGILYNLLSHGMHNLELSAGYLSRGVNGDSRYQGISQTGSGGYLQLGDKYKINENFALQGRLTWSFFNTETPWGKLSINGPALEIQLFIRVITSDMQ